jgi:cytochrome P450
MLCQRAVRCIQFRYTRQAAAATQMHGWRAIDALGRSRAGAHATRGIADERCLPEIGDPRLLQQPVTSNGTRCSTGFLLARCLVFVCKAPGVRSDEELIVFSFDPYSLEFLADPYPLYARLREEAPVFHHPQMKFWVLSRFDDVVAAHADAVTFTSTEGVTIERRTVDQGSSLITMSAPDHGWGKRLVSKLFSRHRMLALEQFIRKRAVELLERAAEEAGDNEFDFVTKFTVQLPLDVISELLGIPEEFRQEIHHLSNGILVRGGSDAAKKSYQALLKANQIYLSIARQRRAHPGDDVISQLMQDEIEDEHGLKHRLSDEEIASRFLEMGLAGHETVAKAIPNGAMALHKFPDERRKLMQDRSLMTNAVDEILRYDPPSQLQGRATTRDVTLHGATIPNGERVMLATAAATRDPRAFADPDRFDVSRKLDVKSVYFGYGVHKCLGIHLARQEIGIAFDELFNRFPNYEVDPNRITRVVLSNVRGVATLPIRLGPHA